MLFNHGAFNRSTFNRESSSTAALYGIISWTRDASSSQPLWTVAPISGSADINFNVSGFLGAFVPFEGETGMTYTSGTDRRMWSKLALSGSTGIVFGVEGQMNNSHTFSFSLVGLNLQSGGSVVIDTDTLDIFVNGVLNVMAWQHGGEFFELAANQDNNIQVYTDGDGHGTLTVQWKDRWY